MPAGASGQFHLQVLQDGSSNPVFTGDQLLHSGAEVTNLPESYFSDGASYSWTAGIDLPGGGIQWTAPCHFSVDHTPPPAPTAVLSDKYAKDPTPPPRRTPRQITLSIPKGSEALGFCYAFGLDPAPSVPAAGQACGNEWAPVRADGTAVITVVPLDPPFDELAVWTVDRAHNQSQPTTLQVPMQWGGIDKLGDITGDGKIDLFSRLGTVFRFNAGKGNGRLGTTQKSTTEFGAPTELVARVGAIHGSGNNGLLGIYNGVLVSLGGDGIGDFLNESCCLGSPDGQDWSTVTQLTGAMNVTGAGSMGFVAVRGGLIQYYPATTFAVQQPTTLGTADKFTQLIGVQDFDGDGKPDLLVREGSTLRLYRGNGDGTFKAPVTFAKGFSISKLADITSDGDANGDGKADLWATTTSGGLEFVPGLGGKGFGKPLPLAKSGWAGVQLY
ncbi:VCBS repeat-containing protein [Streptacidiphilus sp. 4-A2]|nr:VCBS repeat-containing protein [Streptacidiphilus sp. 4-A2]